MTVCVMAQAPGWNCSGTRLAYRSTFIVWPSSRLTLRIASCSLAISAGFSLPGETRVPSSASLRILSAASGPRPLNVVDQELPQRAGVAFAEQFASALRATPCARSTRRRRPAPPRSETDCRDRRPAAAWPPT